MKKIISQILLCAGLLASIETATAQRADSLSHYLELAQQNNPAISQMYHEYLADVEKVAQAGSLPDPELETGVFLSPMELISGEQVANFKLMQMFPWFGVLKNAKSEMDLMAKAKAEALKDAQRELSFELKQNWNLLQKNQQIIRVTEHNLELLQTIERLTTIKLQLPNAGGASTSVGKTSAASANSGSPASMNGMGGGKTPGANTQSSASTAAMPTGNMGATASGSGLLSLYQIQIEEAELENRIATLRAEQSTVEARFNSLLNREASAAISLPDSFLLESLAEIGAAQTDSLLKQNPMLAMLQYEQQALGAKEKMVTRMSYPMIGIGLNYSLINKSEMSSSNMNGKDMIMPMLTITLPVYRKKYHAMAKEAELMRLSKEAAYQSTANALQVAFRETQQNYDDAQRRYHLYKRQSDLTQKSLDILIRIYSSSASGLSDLLRLQQQLLDYELRKNEAIADYNTAVAKFERLASSSQEPKP